MNWLFFIWFLIPFLCFKQAKEDIETFLKLARESAAEVLSIVDERAPE